MKNRDNEFFIEEKLDELIATGALDSLKDQMSRILAYPCCLNGFKYCRKYLEAFSEEEIIRVPYLATAAAVICAIYGNLEKAEEYASYVEEIPLMKLHLDIMIPGKDRQKVERAVKKLAQISRTQGILPNLPLAAGRITLINGFRDMTIYSDLVHDRREQLKEWVREFYGDSAVGIAETAYAEVIALSLQMRIMIATGQIAVVYPILDDIYNRLSKEKSRWLLENFGAVKAWGLMYDGDTDTVEEWMNTEAPSEFGELCMLDTYKYMIKMRAYILQGKYLAMLSLAEYLRKPLEQGDRVMDLCEMNLLSAIAYFQDGRPAEAYGLLDRTLPVLKERRFDRLAADEGEKMYFLLRSYREEWQLKDEYLGRLISLSRKMALLYPDYLRKRQEDYPQLTETETEILCLLADERSNAQIADFMDISINTVKFHAKNIFAKLNVKTRQQAVKVAKENKLLSLR